MNNLTTSQSPILQPSTLNSSTLPLSLEEFLSEIMDIAPHLLTLEQLVNLVSRLHLSENFLNKFTLFKPDKYFWKYLVRNDSVEMLICGWLPGQKSGVHPHTGAALNVSRVLMGTVTEELYEISAQDIVLFRKAEVSVGGFTTTERYQYHQLVNNSTQKCATLHVYAPARPN